MCGKILILGYVISEYIPVKLNAATLYYFFTGEDPSDEIIESSFRNCLSQNDSATLSIAAASTAFGEEQKMQLATIFSKYGFHGLPTPATILSTIREMAIFHMKIASFYILNHLRSGTNLIQSPSPFDGMSDEEFCRFLKLSLIHI